MLFFLICTASRLCRQPCPLSYPYKYFILSSKLNSLIYRKFNWGITSHRCSHIYSINKYLGHILALFNRNNTLRIFKFFWNKNSPAIPAVARSIVKIIKIILFFRFRFVGTFKEFIIFFYSWFSKMNQSRNRDFSCELCRRKCIKSLIKFPCSVKINNRTWILCLNKMHKQKKYNKQTNRIFHGINLFMKNNIKLLAPSLFHILCSTIGQPFHYQ